MDSVDLSHTTKALKALQDYAVQQTSSSNEKNADRLFDDSDRLSLQIALKKVPQTPGVKFVDTILPHSFVNAKTTSICLFVKDLNPKTDYKDHDVDKTSRYFKQFLKEEKLVTSLDEVISLSQLKREYNTYECRRKLCSAYDMFLVDDRIVNRVAGCLGRAFRTTKKMPFPIQISRGNINNCIEKCLSTTRLMYTTGGSRCSVRFGLITQPINHLIENISSILESLDKGLPGGIANIRSINICQGKLPLLPVYVSLGSANLIRFVDPVKSTLNKDESTEQTKVKRKRDYTKFSLARPSKVWLSDRAAGKKRNLKRVKGSKKRKQIGKENDNVKKVKVEHEIEIKHEEIDD